MPKLERLSPGVYRNAKGRLVDPKGKPLKSVSKSFNRRAPGSRTEQGRKKKKPQTRSRDVTISSSDAERQVIYGRFRIGGVWTYGQAGGPDFHLISTMSGHKIGSSSFHTAKLFIDDLEIYFNPNKTPDPRWNAGRYNKYGELEKSWRDRIFWAVMDGADDQPVQPDLKALSDLYFPENNKWQDADIQRGCAYSYLLLRYNSDLYPDGFPDVEFEVDGKVVYDPRVPGHLPGIESTYQYSNNAALVIADFLTNQRYGPAVEWSEIDIDTLIEAANICDELVSVAGGGVERRYTINGVFDFAQDWPGILEEMAATIGGDVVYQAGKWRIMPAKWRGISLSLTESDLRAPLRVEVKGSKKNTFNTVKGTYIDPKNQYEAANFPVVTNARYQSEDGLRLLKELQFNFVTSSSLAQRLARLELERIRQSMVLEVVLALKGFRVQVTDNVELSISKYGWVKKHFEVRQVSLSYDQQRGLLVTLALQETGEGVFNWDAAYETAVDASPNTTLPSPFDVANPTGLTLSSGTGELYIRADGTIVTRLRASWILPNDDFLLSGGFIELQFKRSDELTWREHPRVTGTTTDTYILDVQDGAYYDVRIRSVNPLNIANQNWVTVTGHRVLGKLLPPSDVVGFRAQLSPYGISLMWDPIPDLDLDHYELRQGTGTWDDASFVAEIKGTSFSLSTRKAATYRYFIKAVDTSRNYSTDATTLDFTVLAPEQPIANFGIQSTDVVITWTVPNSFFAVDSYQLSYGDDFLTSTYIQETKGTLFRTRIDWIGNRRYWIAARDVEGNLGTPAAVLVQVLRPNQPANLEVDVVDNNVFLKWGAAAPTTLPIAKYRVFRGPTFATATLIGDVGGTFIAIIELVAGLFYYWVQSVDTAGNVSAERVVTAQVSEPPDFVLVMDQTLNPLDSDVLTNIYIQDYGFLAGQVSAGTGGGTGTPIGLLLALTR